MDRRQDETSLMPIGKTESRSAPPWAIGRARASRDRWPGSRRPCSGAVRGAWMGSLAAGNWSGDGACRRGCCHFCYAWGVVADRDARRSGGERLRRVARPWSGPYSGGGRALRRHRDGHPEGRIALGRGDPPDRRRPPLCSHLGPYPLAPSSVREGWRSETATRPTGTGLANADVAARAVLGFVRPKGWLT